MQRNTELCLGNKRGTDLHKKRGKVTKLKKSGILLLFCRIENMDQSLNKSELQGASECYQSHQQLCSDINKLDSIALQHLINENNMLKRLIAKQSVQQRTAQLSPQASNAPTLPSFLSPSKYTDENTSFFNFTSVKNENARDGQLKPREEFNRGTETDGSTKQGTFLQGKNDRIPSKNHENANEVNLKEGKQPRLSLEGRSLDMASSGLMVPAVRAENLSTDRTGKDSCKSFDLGSFLYNPIARTDPQTDDREHEDSLKVDSQYLVHQCYRDRRGVPAETYIRFY